MHVEVHLPSLVGTPSAAAGRLVHSPCQLSVGLLVFVFVSCKDLLIEIMEMTVLLRLPGGQGCIYHHKAMIRKMRQRVGF